MRLAAPAVELAGVVHRQLLVRGVHIAGVDHGVTLVLLAEDLPHAFAHHGKRTAKCHRRKVRGSAPNLSDAHVVRVIASRIAGFRQTPSWCRTWCTYVG